MKKEMKIKKEMTVETVNEVLQDLVSSFKKGTVCIQEGERFVTLKPGGSIEFEMEAAEKKGKQKLDISLTWRETVPEEKEERTFRISCEEPKIETPDYAPGTEPETTEAHDAETGEGDGSEVNKENGDAEGEKQTYYVNQDNN